MNKNISFSSLKEKVNGTFVIVAILLVFVLLLGFVSWYTFDQGNKTKQSISELSSEYNSNRALVSTLLDMQKNSAAYEAQKEKYDEVIADAGTYTVKDKTIELYELCENYDLVLVSAEVGTLETKDNYQTAKSVITVSGDEADVRRLAVDLISRQEIARIDDFAVTMQDDSTVLAVMTLVNFTK